jgi:hypothetical protein
LRLLPSSRLLLVAPSNLAADLLAQRLLNSGRPKSEVLRVCAFNRPKEDLPDDLLQVSNWSGQDLAFSMPLLTTVTHNMKRVVVVTALMAGKVRPYGDLHRVGGVKRVNKLDPRQMSRCSQACSAACTHAAHCRLAG